MLDRDISSMWRSGHLTVQTERIWAAPHSGAADLNLWGPAATAGRPRLHSVSSSSSKFVPGCCRVCLGASSSWTCTEHLSREVSGGLLTRLYSRPLPDGWTSHPISSFIHSNHQHCTCSEAVGSFSSPGMLDDLEFCVMCVFWKGSDSNNNIVIAYIHTINDCLVN